MVYIHLFGVVFLQPLVFLNIVVDKGDSLLQGDADRFLSPLLLVEPRLCPPSHTKLIRIDADNPRYVECLQLDMEVRERIKNITTTCAPSCYRRVIKFFFSSSVAELRKTRCR